MVLSFEVLQRDLTWAPAQALQVALDREAQRHSVLLEPHE